MAKIEIQIPVLVDASGNWVSNGWSPRPGYSRCNPDWGLMDDCLVEMDGYEPGTNFRKVWVTATIPLPKCEAVVVQAETVKAEDE